jgi:hypothetical protein
MPPITRETFAWPFKGEDWKNRFLIGSLMYLAVYLFSVLGWLGVIAAYGYSFVIMRAVMRGDQPTLPKWERYNELLTDGVKGLLSSFGYLVPMSLVILCAILSLCVGLFAPILSDASPTSQGNMAYLPWMSAGLIGFFVLTFVAWLIAFVIGIPATIGMAQYLRTGKISAGYRLGEVWKILRANIGGFVGALAINFAIGIGLSTFVLLLNFTIILCCLNQFVMAPVLFYQTLLWAYLFGVAYREGCVKAGLVLDLPAK